MLYANHLDHGTQGVSRETIEYRNYNGSGDINSKTSTATVALVKTLQEVCSRDIVSSALSKGQQGSCGS